MEADSSPPRARLEANYLLRPVQISEWTRANTDDNDLQTRKRVFTSLEKLNSATYTKSSTAIEFFAEMWRRPRDARA